MSALDSAWVFLKTKRGGTSLDELAQFLGLIRGEGSKKDISLGISGSRNLKDYNAFKSKVDDWVKVNGLPSQMVSGGQRGADSFARKYAADNDIPFVEHSHTDPRYSKEVNPYYARNRALVHDSTHLLAFPSEVSRGRSIGRDWENTRGGTQWTMRYAQEQGIPVNHHWLEDIE